MFAIRLDVVTLARIPNSRRPKGFVPPSLGDLRAIAQYLWTWQALRYLTNPAVRTTRSSSTMCLTLPRELGVMWFVLWHVKRRVKVLFRTLITFSLFQCTFPIRSHVLCKCVSVSKTRLAAKMSLKKRRLGKVMNTKVYFWTQLQKNTPLTLTSKLVYAFFRPLARFGVHKNPAGVDSIVLM